MNNDNTPRPVEELLKEEFGFIPKTEAMQFKEHEEKTNSQENIEKPQLLTKSLDYQEVENKVVAFLPNAQIGLRIVLAVSASCHFANSLMLWMLFVGVPSSGKT